MVDFAELAGYVGKFAGSKTDKILIAPSWEFARKLA
jgi:hypothetical protein